MIADRNIPASTKSAIAAPSAATSGELVIANASAVSRADDDRRRHPDHRLQPGPDRPADHPPARDPDVAGGRVEDAHDDVEERRLAGAVRPDEADDRPARDLEVDLLDRDEAAERLGHLSGVEDQVRRLRGGRRLGHQSPSAAVGGGMSATSRSPHVARAVGVGSGRALPAATASSPRGPARRAGTGTARSRCSRGPGRAGPGRTG